MNKEKDNPYKGVNEVCVKCEGRCKQFENVVVVYCPIFRETAENKRNRLFKKASEYGLRPRKVGRKV